MSIPFSNTHYRIPQGFGNLLEGLTREILREQPDNIPAFAAAYFENLLEKREKTNFDPAEWGAKVDDRFYNNHAFKEQEPPEKDVPEKEKSQESVNEEETPVTVLVGHTLFLLDLPVDKLHGATLMPARALEMLPPPVDPQDFPPTGL
ncbi:sperm surface protein Sp17 isoform X2 [Tenrec ecaudatus]|uniref:sperm surface protein Sp17 isoform X2 n=1 Tax=Tenrec ecaudatus TaxID=94439 RepID=UPI003F5A389C